MSVAHDDELSGDFFESKDAVAPAVAEGGGRIASSPERTARVIDFARRVVDDPAATDQEREDARVVLGRTDARSRKRRPTPAILGLHKTEAGKPRKLVGNVMTILARDPAWNGAIAYDLFREAPVLTRQPPQREQDAIAIAPGTEWTPQDTTRTSAWLFAVHGLDVGTSMIEDAVLAVAQQRIVHPVREYFASLTWDSTPRVDAFFSTYCRSPDSPYVRGVARMLFLSAVARIQRPGCKVDTIPILEGLQGVFKSSMLAALAHPWFADTPLPIGDKDAYQGLRGVMIYELGELVSLKGRDAARVKSFASSPVDHYRPSYERRVRAVPRHCIFVGTTNEAHYLADATGARRFWPVAVTQIDLEAVRRDRDQLWAEANVRFANGEPWWPSRELEALGSSETDARFEGDPWEAPLLAWLERPVHIRFDEHGHRHELPVDPNSGFTMSEILAHAVGVSLERQGKRDQERAQQILRRAGWVREKNPRRVDGERVRHWQRGPGAGPVPGGGAEGGAA